MTSLQNPNPTPNDKNQEDLSIDTMIPMKKLLKPLFFFLFLGLLSGIFTFYLHSTGTQYLPNKDQCPRIQAKVHNFSIDYNFYDKITRNQYVILNLPGSINRVCPSKSNDISVYWNNVLVTRAETLFDSNNQLIKSKYHVNDCHKNMIYSVKNLEIFDPNDNLIGSVKEENYKGVKVFWVLDKNGSKTARISRNNEFETIWNFEIIDKNHEIAELTILSVIFGKLVILENDLCNSIFNLSGIIAVVFIIISVVLIVYLWFSCWNENKEKNKIN